MTKQYNEEQLKQLVNLANRRLGTEVIYVTDDWFAEANRMLNPDEPVWKEGVYDDNGKWMDGWESRRKREAGYDHAVVKLGVAGSIKAVDIDTRYFTGNYPPSASLEACFIENGDPTSETKWTEILPAVNLQGDSHHIHSIVEKFADQPWTHLRLNIFPDGGVARLRVYGVPFKDWSNQPADELVDLAAALNGGRALACNNQHFGHMSNIIQPGKGINMGDGWETARRRTPGNDWVILALGHAGSIEEILIDTHHFKGNYPDKCSIQAAYVTGGTDDQIETQSLYWEELLPQQKMQPNQEHNYKAEVKDLGPVTHVKINVFPDGGISRVRLMGKVSG